MIEKKLFVWDDRAPSFRQVGDVAVGVAQSHCGVEVDGLTTTRWQELMALLREFDTLCDDTAISREAAMDELRHFENLAELYPALAPDTLPNERAKSLSRGSILSWHLGGKRPKPRSCLNLLIAAPKKPSTRHGC